MLSSIPNVVELWAYFRRVLPTLKVVALRFLLQSSLFV